VLLIIGGGYTGVSAALHLAELKQRTGLPARIILLEAQQVASGPSGKSAGHVCGLQRSDAAVRRHCGLVPGDRLIALAVDGSKLVRRLIERHNIPCDLRDGYVVISNGLEQIVSEKGAEFCIEPYPFVLGLARAAQDIGAVEIYEGTKVTGLERSSIGVRAITMDGAIEASLVLAAGGRQMLETIPSLQPLHSVTTEVRVTTIITDPIPDAVLEGIMPVAGLRRFPFTSESFNVAYGSIDRHKRIIFGACATACADPDPARTFRALTKMFPSLTRKYRESSGSELAWKTLVEAERLVFTRDLLPSVGRCPGNDRAYYVHALGGHGIAVGTLLGKAAAEKLWGLQYGHGASGTAFDAFAAVSHGWLPPRQPWRKVAATVGLFMARWSR